MTWLGESKCGLRSQIGAKRWGVGRFIDDISKQTKHFARVVASKNQDLMDI